MNHPWLHAATCSRAAARSSSASRFAGAIGDALAQGAAAAKPLALTEVDAFLAIDPKGMVTVYSGKVDLGTGVARRSRRWWPRSSTCRCA